MNSSKPTKFPTMVTPQGLAAYAWLTKKDTKYNAEGVYKVSIVLDKSDITPGRIEQGQKALPGLDWVKHLLALCKEYGVPHTPGATGCPVRDGDKMKDALGNSKDAFANKFLMQFKTTYRPGIIDTAGNPVSGTGDSPEQVLNGDLIKVAFNPTHRKVNDNHYLSMYIAKVMLIEKRVHNESTEMFGESEGYVVPQSTISAENLSVDSVSTQSEEYEVDF